MSYDDREVMISVRGLGKAYTIATGGQRHTTMAEAVLARLRRPLHRLSRETFWALRDVSFDVRRGDVVGVIGRNGAGKSTLFKLLSRITEPTTGRIELYGRVGSLLEVGTGFSGELTGRENIFLNGTILGMRRQEIARRFEEIVDFSGVEQFLDTPVKRYSSGMYVRLAFAVAAHLDSDILVVDEVLAVGDADFQAKCIGKMKSVGESGRTVLFVSHNLASVQSLCRSAIMLSAGQLVMASNVEDVADAYLKLSASPVSASNLEERTDRSGTGELRCTGVRLSSTDGVALSRVPTYNPFLIYVDYTSYAHLQDVSVSVDIDSVDGQRITTLYSGFRNETFDVQPGAGFFCCRVEELPLFSNRYRFNVMVGHPSGHIDFIRDVGPIDVEAGDVFGTGRVPLVAHGATIARFSWTK